MGLFDKADKAKTSGQNDGYFTVGRHWVTFRAGRIVKSEKENETYIIFEFDVEASEDPAIRQGQVRSVGVKTSWKSYLDKVKDLWAGFCDVRGLDLNDEFTQSKLEEHFASDCVAFQGIELEIVGSPSAKPMKGSTAHFTNMHYMGRRDELGCPGVAETKAPSAATTPKIF